MKGLNGPHSIIGAVRNTYNSSSSIWLFYMEAEPIHTKRTNGGVRPRLQKVGDDYHKANRPTEKDSNRAKRYNKVLSIIGRYSNKVDKR